MTCSTRAGREPQLVMANDRVATRAPITIRRDLVERRPSEPQLRAPTLGLIIEALVRQTDATLIEISLAENRSTSESERAPEQHRNVFLEGTAYY